MYLLFYVMIIFAADSVFARGRNLLRYVRPPSVGARYQWLPVLVQILFVRAGRKYEAPPKCRPDVWNLSILRRLFAATS